MKKIAFILALLAISCMQVSAQSIDGKRYRVFIELHGLAENYSKGIDAMGFGVSTSHGYQINSHLYAGIGFGLQFHYPLDYEHRGGLNAMPIFGDFRVDLLEGKITPFLDVKAGYSLGEDCRGLYLYPNIGMRIAFKSGQGINLHLGYSIQGYENLLVKDNDYLCGLNFSFSTDF